MAMALSKGIAELKENNYQRDKAHADFVKTNDEYTAWRQITFFIHMATPETKRSCAEKPTGGPHRGPVPEA